MVLRQVIAESASPMHVLRLAARLHRGKSGGRSLRICDYDARLHSMLAAGHRTTRVGHPGWRDWRPDDNQNRAYLSRQTVQPVGTTSDRRSPPSPAHHCPVWSWQVDLKGETLRIFSQQVASPRWYGPKACRDVRPA